MLNNFIGGGQVFLHKVRMFTQVFMRTVHVSLIIGILVSICWNWNDAKLIDWNGVISYRKANIAIMWDGAMGSIRNNIGKDAGSIPSINVKSGAYGTRVKLWKGANPYKIV